MRATADVDPEAARALDGALARGVLYETLALGFATPSADSGARIAAGSEALRGAAALLDAERGQAPPLLPAADAFLALAGDAGPTRHGRVFGHSAGPASPFETEYGAQNDFRQTQDLADLAGTYRAFGLGVAGGGDGRVDHVACECEFMGFLARKEAFLRASAVKGDAETEEDLLATRRAAAGFLRDHLARFGRAFAARVAAEDRSGPYGALGELLVRVLAFECGRLGVPEGPPTLELRVHAEDEMPIGCGGSCPEPRPVPITLGRRP
jgi:TorA maturation chaperone TorD